MRRVIAILFLCLVCFMPVGLAQDDFQYWSRYSIKLLSNELFDFTNYWEMRGFEDASSLGLWYTSQKLQIHPVKNLSFGINYTYLEFEAADAAQKTNEFKYQHRFELEATPHWALPGQFKIKNRNRMEFRWIEGRGSDNGRYRHLWELYRSLDLGWLKGIYINNEFFVDFARHQIAENRVTPVGITLRFNQHAGLKVFYMIQSQKGGFDWKSNQILGTQIDLLL
ncbi:MAG: DUF2490 domain-containing protein [Candidatus Omnitrophica bacterium]|nr:DUF2490 domain-containing protein [Candidatus Omnitrophota bacterium]